MAIKVFFKHLFTGIKRRPMQPILLVTVVAIAVMVSILSMQIDDLLVAEEEGGFYAKNGKSNLIITASSSSDVTNRFIDPQKVASYIGEYGDVCGVYALPFYGTDNKLVKGVLTDLATVGRMFEDLNFENIPTAYGKLAKCVYVTEGFASANGLQVGDKLELKLFNNTKVFTVQGITKSDIMGEYAVMIDASAAVSMMAGGMYDGIFTPYGTVYANIDYEKLYSNMQSAGGAETDLEAVIYQNIQTAQANGGAYNAESAWKDAVSALGGVFPAKTVRENIPDTASMKSDMGNILWLFVVLTALLAVANIYCCFSILTEQRTEENALLCAVGAKSYMLNLLSMAEMAIYWLCGSAVGIGLSIPMLKAVGAVVGFEYCVPSLEVTAALQSALVMFVATQISILVFIAINGIKKCITSRKKPDVELNSKSKVKEIASCSVGGAMLLVAIILVIITVILPQPDKKSLDVPSIALLMIMMFYNGRLIFRKLSAGLSNLGKLPVPVRYGIKNAGRIKSQANAMGLIALVVTICSAMVILSAYCSGFAEMYKGLVDADYVLINATDDTKEKLYSLDTVKDVYDVYSGTLPVLMYDGEYTYQTRPVGHSRGRNTGGEFTDFTILSASDAKAFTDSFQLDGNLPGLGQAYIGVTTKDTYEVEIGDKLAFYLDGSLYSEIEIAGTFRANDNILLVNFKGLENYTSNGKSATYNFVAVKGKDGMDKESLYEGIFEKCNQDNVVITTTEELMKSEMRNMNIYSACVKVMTITVAIFSAVGLIDSIASGYRSRREEFDCYMAAGMNKKSIRLMKASETAYCFLVGIVYAALLFGLVLLQLYECVLGSDSNIFFYL